MNQIERQKLIIKQLKSKDNWRPDLSKISKTTNIPVSTVFDIIKKIPNRYDFSYNVRVKVKDKIVEENDRQPISSSL
jgi:predicted transcriptional regulator